MLEPFIPYTPTVWAMGLTGALILAQIVVLDIAGIGAGHVPGAPVTGDHSRFFWRAVRAHANTNESIGAFILIALFAMIAQGPAWWVNASASLYLAARVAHMLCYYADLKIPRSISFVVSAIALVAMLLVGMLGR